MRIRIISSVVILGLGIAGVTLAQQEGERSKPQAGGKAKLRARMVALRADVELLQLDHEADKALLLEATKGMRKLEDASPAQLRLMAESSDYFDPEPRNKREAAQQKVLNKKLLEAVRPQDPDGGPPSISNDEWQKLVDQAEQEKQELRERELDEAAKRMIDDARARLSAKRKSFVKQATDLAEMRLDLKALEKQYREAE
jgi:hypothetical protein